MLPARGVSRTVAVCILADDMITAQDIELWVCYLRSIAVELPHVDETLFLSWTITAVVR